MIGEVPYLVKEQRAVVGYLEFPRTVCPSIGKCPFDMSEQFAFEKSFRNSSHIDRNQSLFFSVGKHMDLAGKHFLTCPVLSGHQDVGIRPGYFFDQGTKLLHSVTFPPEHSAFLGNDELACGDRNAFTVCRPDRIGRFQCFQQLGVIPGLDHEIGRSFLDSPYGKVDVCIGRKKNDLYRGIFLFYFRKPE